MTRWGTVKEVIIWHLNECVHDETWEVPQGSEGNTNNKVNPSIPNRVWRYPYWVSDNYNACTDGVRRLQFKCISAQTSLYFNKNSKYPSVTFTFRTLRTLTSDSLSLIIYWTRRIIYPSFPDSCFVVQEFALCSPHCPLAEWSCGVCRSASSQTVSHKRPGPHSACFSLHWSPW